MKKNIFIGTLFFTMIATPVAYASTQSNASTTSTPVVDATPTATPTPSQSSSPIPNVDTLPPPSAQLIQENPWQASSIDPAPDNSQIDPSSQDEPETWAVVDANGNTLNTIVCDRDYCGSGWIPTRFEGSTPVEFARVVLQAARNPQNGLNNGGHWGNYNFNSNTWTETNSDGSVYQMPVEYGARPICIENCPTPSPTPTPSPSPSESGNSETPVVEEYSGTSMQERSIVVKPTVVSNGVVINRKLNDKVFKNQVLIVATKGNNKKVWRQQVSGKTVNIKIPRKYLFWNISIRYLVG